MSEQLQKTATHSTTFDIIWNLHEAVRKYFGDFFNDVLIGGDIERDVFKSSLLVGPIFEMVGNLELSIFTHQWIK